ncbi:MAG TPA: hypothetical protein VH206_01405 [Xanthobacteraceae bacterium]|jgi:hypothetical protein|nr:hypothetical protein [Xanthobacteraceae bacterium]
MRSTASVARNEALTFASAAEEALGSVELPGAAADTPAVAPPTSTFCEDELVDGAVTDFTVPFEFLAGDDVEVVATPGRVSRHTKKSAATPKHKMNIAAENSSVRDGREPFSPAVPNDDALEPVSAGCAISTVAPQIGQTGTVEASKTCPSMQRTKCGIT